MHLLPLLFLFLLVVCSSLAARNEAVSDSCSPQFHSWNDLLKRATIQFAGTFEVLLRSFALGFGAHMLKYLLWNNANNVVTYEDLKGRFRVSAVCGLSMASFVFGVSLFLPTQFRVHWFDY